MCLNVETGNTNMLIISLLYADPAPVGVGAGGGLRAAGEVLRAGPGVGADAALAEGAPVAAPRPAAQARQELADRTPTPRAAHLHLIQIILVSPKYDWS